MLGIVRPARRPPGWLPQGPRPSPAAWSRPDLWPHAGEDLCHLSGDWRILQRIDGKRWSLDDLVTAWVATDELGDAPPRRAVDLGCGIGSVLLMIAWRFPAASVVGVEAQEVSVELARRSIAWNGASDRCEARFGDLRDGAVFPDGGSCDLVTGTPPYLPRGTANESSRIQLAPCHFEHRGGIEDYCEAAARLLAPGGCFVTCAGAGQLDRVTAAASANSLTVVRRLDVIPRRGKAPLFSVHAMRPAEDARRSTFVESLLVVRDSAGDRTEDFRTVRRDMGMPP